MAFLSAAETRGRAPVALNPLDFPYCADHLVVAYHDPFALYVDLDPSEPSQEDFADLDL